MITICILAFSVFSGLMCAIAAYRNGVTDGYGYSQEPWNPGYAKAGRYLQRYMYHRWPKLDLRPAEEPPKGEGPK